MTYTKTINGRQVFSSCRVITLNGADISNPTEDQIREAGWVAYVPPAVVPRPQTEPGYDQLMTAIKKMLAHEAENLSDEEALEVAAVYPTWISKVGNMVTLGERL